jgi:hypothetical protein
MHLVLTEGESNDFVNFELRANSTQFGPVLAHIDGVDRLRKHFAFAVGPEYPNGHGHNFSRLTPATHSLQLRELAHAT